MLPEFDTDPYPGKPRILFVGFAESSHTHSWISLLDTTEFNVRLFALPTSAPPPEWNVRTYLTTASLSPIPDSDVRANLDPAQLFQRLLADVIAHWQPHIVHTLGLEPAGFLYDEVCRAFHLNAALRWVLQLRGGSDLALNRFNPAIAPKIAEVLRAADQILSDNGKISRSPKPSARHFVQSSFPRSRPCRGRAALMSKRCTSVQATHCPSAG